MGSRTAVIDAVASQESYARHLLPVVDALRARGHEVNVWATRSGRPWGPWHANRPMQGDLLLCASWVDARRYQRSRVVYLEHGSGQTYCLGPETKVLRSDLRWVPIRTLNVGEEVIAFDEYPGATRARQWQTATVQATETVRRACYRLHMADGTKIVASTDHQWLKRNRETYEWGLTSDLQDAARWPSRSTKMCKAFDVWDEDRTWGAGYLAAAMDGEGCLTQTPRQGRQNRIMLTFTQKPNAMLALVRRELDARGYDYKLPVADIETGVAHLTIRGGARETLRFVGSIRPRRLLANLIPLQNGQMRGRPVELLRSEFIGEQEVVALRTSTGTFFAEGFASHNCDAPGDGYAGASGLDHVVLFVGPGDHVAQRWRDAYPSTPAVSVGCPALDQHFRPECNIGGRDSTTDVALRERARTTISSDPPLVAVSSHWGGSVPECQGALPHYANAIARLPDVRLIGHSHPRSARRNADLWARLGIDFEPDPDVILRTADLLVIDNSSLAYEAAALGIPVLLLNLPTYRRDVDHGLRFWNDVPGLQCDEPTDLAASVQRALDDPPEARALRERATAHVYAYRSGDSAERAADAIEKVL